MQIIWTHFLNSHFVFNKVSIRWCDLIRTPCRFITKIFFLTKTCLFKNKNNTFRFIIDRLGSATQKHTKNLVKEGNSYGEVANLLQVYIKNS